MTDITHNTIRTCQQGNTAAFAEIVQAFERPLFAFVYRLHCTPPGRDVEDVVQEIFVKAYQNIPLYKPTAGSSFTTWLFALARNYCISLMRRKKLEHEAFNDPNPRYTPQVSSQHPSPLEHLQDQESMEEIAVAVSNLPETQRTAFILRHYHDMAYQDIATVLECNEGTVRSRLSRARQALIHSLNLSSCSTPRRHDHE